MASTVSEQVSKPEKARDLDPKVLLHPLVIFAEIFAFDFLLHARLLSLPYFWDEAGYYVAAARDLLLTGSLIPHTTVSNAHPPLVMAWLALWWKLIGFAPIVTRTAMIAVAAFTLLGVFLLAKSVANVQVAIAATLCTAVYPVFFAQSSMAQVDLAAAGLTFWGLAAYIEDRPLGVAAWFSLAVLTKETAILAPAALGLLEIVKWLFPAWLRGIEGSTLPTSIRRMVSLGFTLIPLAAWYTYHYWRTGYIFGNPEFFRYNVSATMNPLRFLLALGLRLWQVFGYMHLWILTLGMAGAMFLAQRKDQGLERRRIAVFVQIAFAAVIVAYVIAMAAIGGAVLARYMLPAVPLVIILAVSTLWRRLRMWALAIGVVVLAFVAGWFWNPPYGFSPEDNLAYSDFIQLHQQAERVLETRYPNTRVMTAWPASDELTQPWLGYTSRPTKIFRIEDFSADQIFSAAELRSKFDVALVFSTKYEPPDPILERWAPWERLKKRFFNFHRDLPPAAIAQILNGKIVFSAKREGLWIALIVMQPQDDIQDARLLTAAEPH